MTLTDTLLDIADGPRPDIGGLADQLARLSLLDWICCGLAGQAEPVAQHLRYLAQDEAGQEHSSLFGGGRAPARMAALVNGATSHALDYDDTHFAHVGHLSVGIYPAGLAVAEHQDASVSQMIGAFVIGAEVAIRTGLALGHGHYHMGFHQTATAGAFGATVAAGWLYQLNRDQMRVAIGLCATRASGLKSQFGTMGKPYNAGIAGSNGVESARLAQLGFSAPDDGLTGPQGFIETHAPDGLCTDVPAAGQWLFEDNKYKLHACCHGTHAMIEALSALRRDHDLRVQDVASLRVRTNPRWLRVCDIKTPRTGLEVKFSYAWLAGMVLRGTATGDDRGYTDDLARDTALGKFAEQVEVIGDPSLSDMQVQGHLILRDGTELAFGHDLQTPRTPEDLHQRLQAKAEAMLGAKGRRVWARFDQLSAMRARQLADALHAP